jgi:hypothetical protein
VAEAFARLNLDWLQYIKSDTALFRQSALQWSEGNPNKAITNFARLPTAKMKEVVVWKLKEELY